MRQLHIFVKLVLFPILIDVFKFFTKSFMMAAQSSRMKEKLK